MEDVTKLMEKWAEEDRAFLASINRKSKWLERSVIIGLFSLIILAVGIGNAPHTAVEVPVADAVALQRLQQENALLTRKVSDYKALSANLAGRLKEANGRLAKLEEERNVLAHSSLPPQPVILQAIRKEAVTEKGLRQVVARNFGKDIATHIQIIQE